MGKKKSREWVAYLEWSCNHLFDTVESENIARATTRSQAHLGFLLIPALLVLVLGADPVEGFQALTTVSRAAMFMAAGVALYNWYRVMAARAVPTVQPTVFTRDDQVGYESTKHDYAHRLLRARNNLVETAEAAQECGNVLARYRQVSLDATVVTVVAAIFPYAIKELKCVLDLMA